MLSAKLAVGLSTGSTAVLGDAVHSLADIANNGVAWLAARVSSNPPDREHPYGHGKFETLAVFLLATLLAVLAIEVALRGLARTDREVVRHGWSLAVMLGVLATNAGVALWEGRWARRLDSDLLRADARHTLSDVLVTGAVISGWQMAAMGWVWLDGAAALGIALLILYLAYGLFRRAVPVLVDEIAAEPEEIERTVGAVGGVRGISRIRSRKAAGGGLIDVVVTVDGAISTHASHQIADRIEQALRQRFAIEDVTVHIEPHAAEEESS